MVEEWREIKGYNGMYLVSNFGRVKTLYKSNRNKTGFLSEFGHNLGYRRVKLKDKTRYVHTLVAEAFLDKYQENLDVNHIDGNKSNNHLSNLEYLTHGDNMRHSFEVLGNWLQVSKSVRGEKSHFAKLTAKQAKEIFKSKIDIKFLSEKYKVSTQNIRLIKNLTTWKHVNG